MNPSILSRRALLRGLLAAPIAGAAPRFVLGQGAAPAGPFTLAPLPYAPEALEPHIDTMTMQIHHGKHHQAYVNNLNAAVAKVPRLASGNLSAEALLRNLERLPEEIRTAVRNNAGGHANHTLFWTLMKPGGGGAPTGPIAEAINGAFGSFEKFREAFNDAGLKRFGSGWVWLFKKQGRLELASFPNQDSPWLEGGTPLLGNDVWEHAYYLKYQNRRADYLKAWWNVVNWDEANRRLSA